MSNDHEPLNAARPPGPDAAGVADHPQLHNAVRALFNRSAPYYDGVNKVFSLGSGAWYRRFCLRRAGLRPGVQVVDIGVGTGLLAREALTLTGDRRSVIGVDVSEAMLAIAQANLGIPLIQGAAEALPLAAAIADFVTMGYALRHVADLEVALREALRILQPGGRIVLLEVGAPRFRINRLLASAYVGGLLPVLSLLLTGKRGARTLMRYHWETIANIMPREAIMRVITEAGFGGVKCESYFDLFQCYIGEKPSPARPNP
jgi:demethylmenaquinone methyltransferase/2-methoxy-6-polyprenyl-1,4-benzoquinol methylase